MDNTAFEKLEAIVETVRRHLEGDAAVAFVHESGHRVTSQGMVRFFRSVGGRSAIAKRIQEGKSNVEILYDVFPSFAGRRPPLAAPVQQDLVDLSGEPLYAAGYGDEDFESTKLAIRLPNDVCRALALAAKMEGVPRNQLIVDLLTGALGRMSPPEHLREYEE